MIHELKCWPEHFGPVASGLKTFEIRRNDRSYRVGDVLCLCEYFPATERFSGAHHYVKVTFILDDKPFVPDGYICMAIKPLAEA